MVCLLFEGSEVAVEPNACGTDPSALWTGEALGWRCLRGGTIFVSLPFLLGSFPPVLPIYNTKRIVRQERSVLNKH